MTTHSQNPDAPTPADATISRRRFLQAAALTLGGGVLAACGASSSSTGEATSASAPETSATSAPAQAAGEPVELLFTFWGSTQEKTALENMVEGFNAAHENIHVTAQHIPDTNNAYQEKIATMLASGSPPDVGYLNEGIALQWVAEGKLPDMTDYYETDPVISTALPSVFYRFGEGRIAAINSAGEIPLLFYNRKLFDDAGISYPPSKADEALKWADFVELAKKLTKDTQGRDATDPNFDSENIDIYGLSFPQWWIGYIPFIFSNGGNFAAEDGTEMTINNPEEVQVLQDLQDLIYVHHVSPTPAQSQALPSGDIMMQTGKVAMTIEGHWKILDLSQLGIEWGVGVLPIYKEPITVMLGGVTVIFQDKHHDEVMTFFRWHNDPSKVDLFSRGLWMPIHEAYYTDETKIDAWLNGTPGVYPAESRDAIVNYTLNNTPKQPPIYWLKNYPKIMSDAVEPAMSKLWANEGTAQEIADEIVATAKPLMQGRWTS